MTELYFCGTPHFAQIVLQELIEGEKDIGTYKIAGVFTKKGSLVETLARHHHLACATPKNKTELTNSVKSSALRDSIFIVSAYGIIFPKEVLDYPKLGCFNIHGSLLPEYRGASPIQKALLDGKKRTGVTVILMDEGVDTGKIAAQAEVAIGPRDTYPTLSENIAHLGARLVQETLLAPLPHRLQLVKQEGPPTMAPPIKKEDGFVTASEITAKPQQIVRKLAAFTPWPGVYTTVGQLIEAYSPAPVTPLTPSKDKKVKILGAALDPSGKLAISKLQLEGKKPISWQEFENGYLKM